MKQKRSVIILIAIMSGFIGGVLFLIYQFSGSAQTNSRRLFSDYTEILAKDIGLSFMRKRDYAEICSLLPSIKSLDWNATKRDFVHLVKQLYAEAHTYAYLIVLKDGRYFHSNANGNPALGWLASTDDEDPNAKPLSLADRDHFQHLIADNPAGVKLTYVSTQNFSKVTGQKQTLFSSNIINDQGEMVGYFSLVYSALSMSEELVGLTRSVNSNYGKDAAFYLIANDGAVLSIQKYDSRNGAYTERSMNTNTLIGVNNLPGELAGAMEELLTTEQSVLTYNEKSGKHYIAYALVPGTDYHVFLTVPYDMINADVAHIRLIALALLVVIAGTITAIIVFIDRVVAAKEEAVQANRTKNRFLAAMGHELRTPMVAVIGMADMAGKTGDIEKIHACLKNIMHASRHLLEIINDILDISSIEANHFTLEYGEFNLRDALSTIINIVRVRTDEKKQRLVINIAPDMPEVVLSDQRRLSQIVLNLLYNAVKFTPENGTITFVVQKIGRDDNRSLLQIEVHDTGVGISEEYQKKLFKSFAQEDDSTSRKFGGAGIGLAIVKNIVDLMHGKIWLESATGQGSTFICQIEVEQPYDAESVEGELPEESSDYGNMFTGKNILVAEDIEINQEIIGAMLEETGCAIDFANNGREAIDLFKENQEKFDIILMDMQMPEIDGLEATRRIRMLDGNKAKNIPIIAVTANIMQEDVENCLKSGMNAHIGKPLDGDILMKTLRSYLIGEEIPR
ncbi:MAG: response regulator [Treponema sp.]|jgi:signal transduction histidine kinase/CheY-like chemotaxis protein|nr:response regulator [Treponema sp.]